jgi:transcriptional regulator with XRE-family HTH domain
MKQPGFGRKLVEIRRANGLTQDELAEKCNITVRTIQRIEAGLVKPRAFTIKVISSTLGFDFHATSKFTSEDVDNANQNSNMEWFSTILWSVKDLFNLKTNTMKKVTILSVVFCSVCIGLFTLINESQAQNSNKLDYSNFVESNGRGIIYFFPKGELVKISNIKDTADYKIKSGLIQEYKNNIYMDGNYIGKALKSDTVIYIDRKIIIKSSYWEYMSSYGQNIHYLIPIGVPIDNISVQRDTENIFIGKHHIKESEYKIFFDDVFQGQSHSGDSIVFKDDKLTILE